LRYCISTATATSSAAGSGSISTAGATADRRGRTALARAQSRATRTSRSSSGFATAAADGSRLVNLSECMVTQYGQAFAAETSTATASFAVRPIRPGTSSHSRSMIQLAASSSGAVA
jgi:hypothetical protein